MYQEDYMAMRYEDDGNAYVVRGPLVAGMHVMEADVRSVPPDGVFPFPGQIVVCRGLRNASHLNGKVGVLGSWDKGSGRYGVHFEDAKLKPANVKLENLRLVFDLPNEE